MKSKIIAEEITAIIEYCRGIRTNNNIKGVKKNLSYLFEDSKLDYMLKRLYGFI